MSEEARYRAASALDVADPGALPRLLGYLADPSWRVRRAAVERIAALADPSPALPGLLEALVGGGSPGARNAASAALVALGAPAVPAVAARLDSGIPEERSAAAEVLGEIGDRRAVPALSGRMADPDENVRNAAAEALGKIGGAPAVQALLGALGQDDRALRLAALDALERLGEAPAVERLEELARDRMLRRPAYRLLGLSDDPAALALVARALGDAARSCREAALAAVGELRLRRGAALLGPLADAVRESVARTAVAWIEEAIGSEDRAVAAGAVGVLGWLADPRRAPALVAAAGREDLRSLAFEALEALGPEAGAALEAALPGLAPEARVGALAALARLGRGPALDELCRIAASDEPARLFAVEALGRIGDARAAGPLAALLAAADPEAAASAGEALAAIGGRGEPERREVAARCRAAPGAAPARLRLLGRVGDGADLAAAREALGSADPLVRVAAAAALEGLGARGHAGGHVRALLDALDDPVAEVRAAAARALGTLAGRRREAPGAPGDEVARGLAAALHDEEPAVRAVAALAVGRLELGELAPALADLASPAAPPEVAAAAAHALGELGGGDLQALRRAAAHADPEVVKEVVAAAARAPGPEARELLVEVAAHARWDVRGAAARALAARADPAALGAVRRLAAAEEDPLVARALGEALRVLEAAAAGKG